MYNGGQSRQEHYRLIIDRHISWEILRPFITGLGLLVLVFIGFSAASQLSLAAEGKLDIWCCWMVVKNHFISQKYVGFILV